MYKSEMLTQVTARNVGDPFWDTSVVMMQNDMVVYLYFWNYTCHKIQLITNYLWTM